jgi:hypothetical protein
MLKRTLSSAIAARWRLFEFLGRLPKTDDCTSSDHQRTTDQDWHCGERSERDGVNDLPDHKERRNIKPDHAPKVERCYIEKRSVAQKQRRASEKQPYTDQTHVAVNRQSDNGVAAGFQRRCDKQ